MEGLLGNPVLQGLLGGGGPMGVRAQSQQQLAQMMPRGNGGMIGAPSAPAPDRSGAAAIASLGQSAAGAITGIAQKNAAEEAEQQEIAMLTGVVGTLPEDLQTKVAPMLQSASGRKMLMGLVGDRLKGAEPKMEKDVNGILRYVGGPNNGQQVFDGVTPTAKPLTALAQSKADLEAGLITPEQHEAVVRKATYIAPTGDGGPKSPYGSGFDAGALEEATRISLKIENGEPLTPRERLQYPAILSKLESGETRKDASGNEYYVPGMNVSGFVRLTGTTSAAGGTPQTVGDPNAQPTGKRAPLSGEVAGKVALAQTVLQNKGDIDYLFSDDGTIDRTVLWELNNNQIRSDKATRAYRYIYDLVDTRLRVTTGAQAPIEEVEKAVRAILPSTLSGASPKTLRSNINREIQFIENFLKSQDRLPNKAPANGASQQSVPPPPPGAVIIE
jgi:hypothetical protein